MPYEDERQLLEWLLAFDWRVIAGMAIEQGAGSAWCSVATRREYPGRG